MVGEGIADLLEAPPVDLRARGFRRVTPARRAWDKRISDDIVWRISIDGSAGRWEIVAGVVLTFFDAVRPFTTLIRAPYDWDEEVVRNPSARHGCVSIAWPVEGGRSGLPWSHRVPNARLARLVEEEVLPYLARFPSLMAVLDELLATRDRTSSKARGDSARYFASCEIALLKWRLGDIAGAEAELDRAAQSIVRLEYPSITLWPPSAWRATSDDDETLKFVEVTLGEQKAYIADLRDFVQRHDPALRTTPFPQCPGLHDVARTWRAGRWRKQWLRPPWKEPTLLVQAHDEDVVGIMYGPVGTGSGEAWLGPGPAYFDDDATYDVDAAAAGLAAWAEQATGTRPDPLALRELISPSSTVDLVEALTELCRLLGLELPKS